MFDKEKSFDKCRSDITNSLLYFDFYLTLINFMQSSLSINALIEDDGLQHFQIITLDKTEKEFAKRIYHDNIKNYFCFNSKQHLLRVSYSEIEHMEEHILIFLSALWNSIGKDDVVIHFCGIEYFDLHKDNKPFVYYVKFYYKQNNILYGPLFKQE